ncbi:hypothetical protein JOF56_003693 [Kibdelosporangium banguiense]|uniref:Uncharacterized protein n=1 Tax=Kibdelosporangium banguiense TaxID=1365924 RepID=A0ABS4TFV6_9PSEU|nr:hypothetical protein [Kibdelosporangium banguiense]MBP2323308.1 hypothetical protein [Kibdelosporangium banguiense]
MPGTATPDYRPGDKVRVLVDEPYATELAEGDIVTVIEQRTKVEQGEEVEVVAVSTNHGNRWLGLDVVEPFRDDYKPAEPDELIDAQFRALLESDEELTRWASDADTTLGAEDEKVPGQLTPEQFDGLTSLPGKENRFRATDYAGDVLDVYYAERECADHGRESAFVFDINDGDDVVVIPAGSVGPLIAFLLDRARFSKRPR